MANMGRRLIRSHKYRLYPNWAQEAALSDMRGHFRDLCNAGLQQRTEAWRRQHPCFEARPDSAFSDGFGNSEIEFSTACPHLDTVRASKSTPVARARPVH